MVPRKQFSFPKTQLNTVQRNDLRFSLKIFLLLQTFSNRLLHQKKNTTKLFMNLNPEIQTRWHWMMETSWWWVCAMQCTLCFVTKEIGIVVPITANRLCLWVLHLTGNYFLINSSHLHIGKIEMENLSDIPLCQTSIIFKVFDENHYICNQQCISDALGMDNIFVIRTSTLSIYLYMRWQYVVWWQLLASLRDDERNDNDMNQWFDWLNGEK